MKPDPHTEVKIIWLVKGQGLICALNIIGKFPLRTEPL